MIEFHDVSKTFAGRPAASHLNLNFAEGAFSVLIGTSGSGGKKKQGVVLMPF